MFMFMSDTLTLSQFTGLTESGAASTGSTLSTGDLRRKYDFGDKVSELSIPQDPYFRFLAKLRKQPVNDTQFKFTEERPSFHKRYTYVVAHGTNSSVSTTADATVTATNIAAGDTYYFKLGSDYKTAGNIGNVYDANSGARSNTIAIGATGTRPNWIFEGLVLKVPFGSDYQTPNDFILGRVQSVTYSGEYAIVELLVTRTLGTSTNNELQWLSATAPMSATYDVSHANILAGLESKKTYAAGNAFGKGSGYPDTWADNPYSTGYGQTQIFKTALGMDNSTRAVEFRYARNEMARLWMNKLVDHKWDLEHAALFSSQYTDASGIQYTQGALDYIVKYGNIFSLTHSSKTADDFLDDMSQYVDPRYNSMNATLFLVDKYTYNWMNKLSGYFNNNVQISPNFRTELMFKGVSDKLGVAVTKFSTIYGDMNVVHDPHLDGTGVHIMAINLNGVKYRPLVGNGINRDTSVYVGVQTLENSGVDKRVDLILTEAGIEMSLPETHAVWKS